MESLYPNILALIFLFYIVFDRERSSRNILVVVWVCVHKILMTSRKGPENIRAYECFDCACLCLTLYSCLGTSYVETTRTSFRILVPAPCMPPSLQWPIHPSNMHAQRAGHRSHRSHCVSPRPPMQSQAGISPCQILDMWYVTTQREVLDQSSTFI